MRVRVTEKTVFAYDELSESAKARARDWWREGALDYDWWEHIYTDAQTVFALAGIELGTKTVKLMGGGTRQDPEIYFQLDRGGGVAFSGSWASCDVKPVRAMQAHAPYLRRDKRTHGNKPLRELAIEANRIKRADRNANASISTAGRDTSVSVNADARTDELRDRIEELVKDAAHWLYRQLEDEMEYQLSDEQAAESIQANEYEFTEEGRIA